MAKVSRWTVEENFQAAKELAGLDQHQVRRWTSWYRRATLPMLAAAFLAVTATTGQARYPGSRITVHGTRKTCGSLLAALEVHQRVATQILRHSKIAVTMEIYTEVP